MLEACPPAFTNARTSCYKLRSHSTVPRCWLWNSSGGRERPMKRPEEVTLSREQGEALIERLERDALSAEDRRGVVEGLAFFFLVVFVAVGEAKLSLKRLKPLVFGEKPKKPEPPESGGSTGSSGGGGGAGRGPAASQQGASVRGRGPAPASERRRGD